MIIIAAERDAQRSSNGDTMQANTISSRGSQTIWLWVVGVALIILYAIGQTPNEETKWEPPPDRRWSDEYKVRPKYDRVFAVFQIASNYGGASRFPESDILVICREGGKGTFLAFFERTPDRLLFRGHMPINSQWLEGQPFLERFSPDNFRLVSDGLLYYEKGGPISLYTPCSHDVLRNW